MLIENFKKAAWVFHERSIILENWLTCKKNQHLVWCPAARMIKDKKNWNFMIMVTKTNETNTQKSRFSNVFNIRYEKAYRPEGTPEVIKSWMWETPAVRRRQMWECRREMRGRLCERRVSRRRRMWGSEMEQSTYGLFLLVWKKRRITKSPHSCAHLD